MLKHMYISCGFDVIASRPKYSFWLEAAFISDAVMVHEKQMLKLCNHTESVFCICACAAAPNCFINQTTVLLKMGHNVF